MTAAVDILRDSFERVADDLPAALEGLTAEQLLWQPAPAANHIAWLAWHIGRCEDAQIAPIGAVPQVYQDGWAKRFALPSGPSATGYGQSIEQVRAFPLTDPSLFTVYSAAGHAATQRVLDGLSDDDLSSTVEDSYRVTVAVRLVSIVNDITQHLGQIGYLRGLIEKG